MKSAYWVPVLVVILLAVAGWQQQTRGSNYVEKVPDDSIVIITMGKISETLSDVKEMVYMTTWIRIDRGDQGVRVFPAERITEIEIRLRNK